MKKRAKWTRAKVLAVLLALALLVGGAVGGTLAWLTAKTDSVTNTFTVGNINITLKESENLNLKMVPGSTIKKDPKVTVLANSEACYLFVKVEKSETLDTYISYEMADGWELLAGENNVFWRRHGATDNTDGTSVSVLKDDQVTVNGSVTKEQMDALNKAGAVQPTLTFTAYAVQQANVDSATDAWGYTTNPSGN